MTSPALRSAMIAADLVSASFGGVPAAASGALLQPAQWYDDDEWYYRPPPLALPQQLNGVIRPPREGERGAPDRLERIPDIFRALRSCWRFVPSERGPSGQQLTLRLSFKRDGQVLGRPQITYYQPGGDRDAQESFRRSVMQAFQRCTPLPLSDALGSAIAGRPFTFRFTDDRAL